MTNIVFHSTTQEHFTPRRDVEVWDALGQGKCDGQEYCGDPKSTDILFASTQYPPPFTGRGWIAVLDVSECECKVGQWLSERERIIEGEDIERVKVLGTIADDESSEWAPIVREWAGGSPDDRI